MTRTRNMADLLDSSGDIKSGRFDNLTTDVVGDTTPQLGGNLDVNGSSIVSASNGNIAITPNGTGSVVIDGLSHPQSDGSAGQFLKTDGSGNLSFATVSQTLSALSVTATATELNVLDGITASTAELNILDGVTATASELNILDGVTATAAELNILDGVTATTTELNYVDGVTSAIQTQIDNINTDLSNDTTPQLGGNLDTNSNNINFADNDKAQFGAGNDLQIYHDGSHSYIDDTGTGSLLIRSNELRVNKYTGEYMLRAFADSSVELYHDNSKKFETTSGGVAVTGDLTATNVFASNVSGLDGTDYINFVNNTQLDFYINGNNEFRFEADGDFHADGNVIAYSTTVSDPRLKENIQPVTDALAKVEQLNGYTFTYKADGVTSAGVMSPEVREVLPSAIKQSKLPLKTGEDNETLYDIVQYDQLHALLIEAVKELSARVQELENGATN